jgi:molybdate transport system ATP-binding protein
MSLEASFAKQYDGFKLDIDIKIGNELVIFFGPSGSGKSLTLKIIAGLIHPDSGTIILNNRLLFKKPGVKIKPQHRSIGYVFQNHSIFPHMTVWQNIAFGAKGFDKNIAGDMTASMIHTFNLEGLEKKYPHQISGGQQQRTALARALIKRPDALLLDEPFSALDNPMRIRMRQCLKNVLLNLDMPVALVTHDIAEACSLGNKIFIYAHGRILQSGTPADIINNPLTEEVASLVNGARAENWKKT